MDQHLSPAQSSTPEPESFTWEFCPVCGRGTRVNIAFGIAALRGHYDIRQPGLTMVLCKGSGYVLSVDDDHDPVEEDR